MNIKPTLKTTIILIAALVMSVLAMSVPSYAAVFNLTADYTVKTMPDGRIITMWGFGLDGGPATVPGPVLTVPPGDTTLTINLTNKLLSPVSIVIPGQTAILMPVKFLDAQGRARVKSFTYETDPNGGINTYSWSNLKPGTYLYHSGTHPAVQVQMGLYGCLKADAAALTAYPGITYENEAILLYSEIDPFLHAAVSDGTYGTAAYPSTMNYSPRYFLINGQPYPSGQPLLDHPISLNEKVLLRFLNAGINTHVPTLQNLYMDVITEDGNLYPYPKKQYSLLLPAGKTADAILRPDMDGKHAFYDRMQALTNADVSPGGMLAYLTVGSVAGAPVAANDNFSTAEDTPLSVPPAGVLANDTGTAPLTAVLDSPPGGGSVTLNADGSFSYTPATNFSGTELFTYRATDGAIMSNVATVRVSVSPVNDPPVAANDTYSAVDGVALAVAAPGVLGNDVDMDSTELEAGLVSGTTGGTLSLSPDGSFTYTSNPGTLSDSFTYVATDGQLDSNIATVTINISAKVNKAPVAVDDYASTTKNTSVLISLVANDYDPDGTINASTVTIITKPTLGGAVVNNLNGTVTFTPKKNFRGTDLFTYKVSDNEGAASNEATVRVTVK